MRSKPTRPQRRLLPLAPTLIGILLAVLAATAGPAVTDLASATTTSGSGGTSTTTTTTGSGSTGGTGGTSTTTTTMGSGGTGGTGGSGSQPPPSTSPAGSGGSASGQYPGYWLVASDGGIFSFGTPFYGSMGGKPLNKPIVGIAATPSGRGYWEVASDGGIFSFGDAAFHGSMGGKPLNKPVVAMAADKATGGYWLVASDGGIFSFDAPFYGSMGGKPLNKPIVGMTATPDGKGYWMVATDGGIFSFGDATFHGSMGGKPLNKPIVAMAATPTGKGYWMVASDGGMFTFGNAIYEGSLGSDVLARPIVAMATADSGGYWMTDTNGAVTAFGDAGYAGSAPQHLNRPVVAMAEAPATGINSNFAFPSGAYGYDVSKFQDNHTCTATLPSGHTVGVVEVTGLANAAPNPCLAHEAKWAGAGLGLYIFMNHGTSTTAEPGCNANTSCNWGYRAALYALSYAKSQGVATGVTWWLDIEGASQYWSSNTSANDQTIAGAITALRSAGINNVGVYTSPLSWSSIAGKYQPAVPLWIAWYTGNPQRNCIQARAFAAAHGDMLPTGPVVLTQYTTNGGTLDGDYAC